MAVMYIECPYCFIRNKLKFKLTIVMYGACLSRRTDSKKKNANSKKEMQIPQTLFKRIAACLNMLSCNITRRQQDIFYTGELMS